MRHTVHLLPYLFAFSILLCGTMGCHSHPEATESTADSTKTVMDTTANIVLQINRCARLYTTEFRIHKIVTHSDDPTLEGHLLGIPIKMNTRIGDRKIAIPIDVTLKGYVDFSDFNANNVERTDSNIIITLPNPGIIATTSQVDHRNTRQFIDLTRSRYTDEEITDLTHQGAEHILSHISQYGIIEQTRISAARTLAPMLQRMGYKEEQIEIRFGKKFNDQELLKIIQKQ